MNNKFVQLLLPLFDERGNPFVPYTESNPPPAQADEPETEQIICSVSDPNSGQQLVWHEFEALFETEFT